MNLDTAKDEVAKYYESGQYAEELTAIIEEAKEKFSKVEPTQNSAVIFDIDETALDNYKEIKRIGFGYERQLWEEWLQKAEAPATPQVKSLYDFLIERGFKVVFITGKKDYQYNATLKNMIAAGYTKFDTIITRSKDEYKVKSAQYKSQKRSDLVGKGYVIAGCIGDQLTDCVGENCGIVVKLPNYLYLVE
jgi:acid phosphatase